VEWCALTPCVRSLPHHALGPELTSDYKERATLYAYSEMFSLFGVIAAAATPGILSQFVPDTRFIFFVMALVIGILLVVSFGFLLFIVREPQQTVKDGNPFIPGLRRAWRNYPFRVLVLASVVGSIGQHCSSLMFPFFIRCVPPVVASPADVTGRFSVAMCSTPRAMRSG
jgi:Na+/melibiose symporter-like transporter